MESQAVELFQTQFERRAELTALVDARPFTDRARRFLTLAINAAFEQAAPGVRCRWLQQRLWLHAEQSRLAELLECSDRTIRELIRVELEPQGFLKRVKAVPQDSGPPREVLIYVIDVERLRAVPVLDATDPIDAAILSTCGDPWACEDSPMCDVESLSAGASEPEQRRMSAGCEGESTAEKTGNSAADSPVSGASSGASSGGSSGGSSGLSCHDHEQEHEYKTHSHDHDHEHGDYFSLSWGGRTLTDEIVRRIVRDRDRAAFDFLDNEGIKAFGWKDAEISKLDRAAVWHHVATNRKIRSPAAVLKSKMRSGDFKTLTQPDSEWARQFLKPPKPKMPPPQETVALAARFRSLDDRNLLEGF